MKETRAVKASPQPVLGAVTLASNEMRDKLYGRMVRAIEETYTSTDSKIADMRNLLALEEFHEQAITRYHRELRVIDERIAGLSM